MGGLGNFLEGIEIVVSDDGIPTIALDRCNTSRGIARRLRFMTGNIISDDIAQAYQIVAIAPLELTQRLLKKLEILMDITNQANSHNMTEPRGLWNSCQLAELSKLKNS